MPDTPNATNRMLCWDFDSDRVALVPWPDTRRLSDAYDCTSLACYTEIQDMDFEARKKAVFIEAMHLIVRDGCDPLAVHRALLGLEEYRDGLAEDALWLNPRKAEGRVER